MPEKASKRWGRRFLSLIGVGYLVLVGWFSYLSIFYSISVSQKCLFCVTLCVISFGVLVAMYFCRYQVLTRLVGFLLLPAMLPFVLLYFGEWELILPVFITALLAFFFSGAGGRAKTILGVIYLLVYVLGSLVFFMLIAFFSSSTEQMILESGVSPSGLYRYEVLCADDSSGGDIEIHVAPSDRDIELPMVTFGANGFDRTVYMERPIPDGIANFDPDSADTSETLVTWKTEKRSDITQELLSISSEIQIELSAEQRQLLGISDIVETVYLRTLTEDQLELLGVPEENDVLIFDDKVCFRTYTAVLEDYFNDDNRSISLFD